MPNLNRLWTAEEDARVRSMLEADVPLVLVAAKLKRTAAAVKSRSSKLHISRQRTRRRAQGPYRIAVDFSKEPSKDTLLTDRRHDQCRR